MNFAAVDLNLLRVFDAMMLELSTVRTAERMAMAQPDVVAAVGRLRHIAGDELFVLDGIRMVPTPRAIELSIPIREALRQIEEALTAASTFDPATAERVFTLAAADHLAPVLVPGLAERLVKDAPGISLRVVDDPDPFAVLDDGLADVAIERELETPDFIRSEDLFVSSLACVARKRHSTIALSAAKPGERLAWNLYCGSPHVIMSRDGGRRTSIDPVLEARGMSRRVAMTVPSFQAVALAAAHSDMIGNLPLHVARDAAPRLDLDVFQPPFELPVTAFRLYWHKRHEQDPANRWLRAELGRLFDTGGQRLSCAPAA